MNKKILSAAIAAVLALSSASSNAATVFSNDTANLDVIGRMKINLNNNDANADRRLEGIARLGLDGKTKVNDYLSVYGQILYEIQAQEPTNKDDSRIDVYYGYVGFDFNDFGKLQFGHFEDAYYKVVSVGDVFVDWGTMGNTYNGVSDNDTGGRKDGVALYEVNYNGLIFTASYQFRDTSKHVNYGTGATLGYEFEVGDKAIGFMGGYNHIEGYDPHMEGNILNGANKNETAISIYYGEYGTPGFYAAAIYNWDKLQSTYKVNGVEAVLGYTTPGGDWTFGAAYGYLHNVDRGLTRNALGSDDRVFQSAWTGEVIYNVTSNFQIYGEAERHNSSVVHQEAENALSLGLIYNF
jgi:predicted porin